MFSLHDLLWMSLCDVPECLLHGIFSTCDPVEQMESNTVKNSENVTVNLLFYGRQSKSFPGHYDDDLW